MDTRQKILDLTGASTRLATGEWIVVPGFFDPLTAIQAKRLAALTGNGKKLAAIVLNIQPSLLPADARAVLIAALRTVDLVAIAPDDLWRAAVPTSPNIHIVEDLHGEHQRTADFINFVIARQKGL